MHPVYGILLHWEGTEDDRPDFFFVSPDAELYVEVARFPIINSDEEAKHYHDELKQQLYGPYKAGETRMFRYTRRYFSQAEAESDKSIEDDSRLWPHITERPSKDGPLDPTEYGLPADVAYPRLGMSKAQTA